MLNQNNNELNIIINKEKNQLENNQEKNFNFLGKKHLIKNNASIINISESKETETTTETYCDPSNKYYYLFNYMLHPNQAILNELECPICLKILDNPYYCLKCNRHFCYNCISSQKECPFRCSDKLEIAGINRLFSNILNQTELKCINEKNGCKEIILFEKYENHLKECNYYKCENNGCDFIGNKNKYENHKKICIYRCIPCLKCKKNISCMLKW